MKCSHQQSFKAPLLALTLHPAASDLAFAAPSWKGRRALRPQRDRKALEQLSKDYEGCDVRSAELLIDGAALLFLASDAQSGVHAHKFDQAPEHHHQTLGGRRLLDLCAPACSPPPPRATGSANRTECQASGAPGASYCLTQEDCASNQRTRGFNPTALHLRC